MLITLLFQPKWGMKAIKSNFSSGVPFCESVPGIVSHSFQLGPITDVGRGCSRGYSSRGYSSRDPYTACATAYKDWHCQAGTRSPFSSETAAQCNAAVNQEWPGWGRSKCLQSFTEIFESAKSSLAQMEHPRLAHQTSWFLPSNSPSSDGHYCLYPSVMI